MEWRARAARHAGTGTASLPDVYAELPLSEFTHLDPADDGRFYFDILTHPNRNDSFWNDLEVRTEAFVRIVTPVLHIGGWYDSFIDEQLTELHAPRAS